MPSRLLREGILDSEPVNSLSWPAEVFYRRLMSVVDDYGRFDGRPAVLRSRMYPLKVAVVSEADVSSWLAECERAGLVSRYTVESKPYLLFHKLGPARAKESKYPAPVGTDAGPNPNTHPFTSENGCERMKTDAPYSGSGSGTDSGAGSGPTSGAVGGRSVGRRDPLVDDEKAVKSFLSAWNESGLKPIQPRAFNPALRGKLLQFLLDDWWAEHWPAAVARAGQIPFLATGAGRQAGRLDVADFFRDLDFVRQVLDGKFDPNPRPAAAAGAGPSKMASVLEQAQRIHDSIHGKGAEHGPA